MAHEPGAIGIFDSGVGGLTVFREVAHRLPHESIIYLGDTARVPYGTKSPETVIRYAQSCARLLLQREVKLLVVACNTASAFALESLWDTLDVPVIGVIEPGARAALRRTESGRIGIIGTQGTVTSGAYEDILRQLMPEAVVHSRPCPLFVPLAEEGWVEGDVPLAIARSYLHDLLECAIDTLVLGCTHYPLLKRTIGQVAGPGISLVDSAEETADVVKETIAHLGMQSPEAEGRHTFLVTDAPESFGRVARHFLGRELHEVEWVDV
jgi:glutamate racemase